MSFHDESNRRSFQDEKRLPFADDTVRATDWNPDESKMTAYVEREVTIACSNIKKLWAKGVKKLTPDDMLCSTTTMTRALGVLRESGLDA